MSYAITGLKQQDSDARDSSSHPQVRNALKNVLGAKLHFSCFRASYNSYQITLKESIINCNYDWHFKKDQHQKYKKHLEVFI